MRAPWFWLVLAACRSVGPPGVDSDDPDVDPGTDATDNDVDTDAETDTDSDTEPPTPGAGWRWGADNDAANADASLLGEIRGEGAGHCLAAIPSDQVAGIDDLLVGAPYYDGYRGRVFRVAGGSRWGLDMPLTSHPHVVGAEPWAEACTPIEGDFDADGRIDVMLAYGYNTVYTETVIGVRGGTWATPTTPTVRVHGAGMGGRLAGLAPIGDVDGDGRDDVWMYDSDNEAWFWVLGDTLSGEVGMPTHASRHVVDEEAIWPIGRASRVADLDGDGRGDAIGERRASSEILGFGGQGATGAEPAAAAAFLRIACPDRCKAFVAGDLDADGLDDLVVTTPSGGAGFFGRTDWRDVHDFGDADLSFDPAVEAPVDVGDLDGDGWHDFAAFHANTATGGDTLVWFGGGVWPAIVDAASADVVIVGVGQGGALWHDPYRRAPDLDGDGLADLVIGNSGLAVDGVAGAGGITVFTGRSAWPATLAASDADVRFVGRRADGWFGYAGWGWWTAILDLNGDGRDDLAVLDSTNSPDAGGVLLFLGRPR